MCTYILSRGVGLVAILILAFLAYPLDSAAQDVTKVWHIGLIHIGHGHVPPSVPALRQKLKDLGYEDRPVRPLRHPTNQLNIREF